MDYIKTQEWRYATKKFDADKKISQKNLETIKRSIQLSASSYGLQPYMVLIIEDYELRERLQAASWDQSQITDASHLIVFCNYINVKSSHIDDFIKLTAKTRALDIEELKGYGDFMKSKVVEKPSREQFNWTKHQTYIALGNLLSICSDLKIDACPMEGFEPEQYNELLGLTEKGLNASVIATIGYRAKDDETQNWEKVRKPIDFLFEYV